MSIGPLKNMPLVRTPFKKAAMQVIRATGMFRHVTSAELGALLKGHAHDYARARGYSSMTDLDEITGTTLSLSRPGDEETTIDGVR